MKKLFLFCALLAGIAVVTGCQKDQDVVTLKAVIDQDTKAFFGGSDSDTPYWDGSDRVYLKGSTRDFTRESCILDLPENSTTVATIRDVPISNVYCAIFPASAVLDMGTPDAAGTTAKINFKHDQEYIENSNGQRLEMPMGAVSANNDNTLIFKNLCGILRVKVVNTTGAAFDVTRVSVISNDGTFIAGDGTVTLFQDDGDPQTHTDDPQISMSPYHITNVDQAIQLHTPGGYASMGTIASSTDGTSFKTFDIIVPPFSIIGTSETNGSLTFDVETNHGYFSYTVNRNLQVERNEIAEVTLTVNSLSVNNHAYLIDGPTFNTRIKTLPGINSAKTIKFCNAGFVLSDHSPVVNLEADYSPLPVYGFYDNTSYTIVIYTPASEIYANPNCKNMFKGLTSIENIYHTIPLIAEDVVDMSYMFYGCSSYHIIPGSGSIVEEFNTTNVETMAHMFDGCSLLNQLDLSSYNTQHLRPEGMVAMFNGCATLSTLNLSSFTTEQITDMSDLFNGCVAMTNLYLNNFDMTNVTNKTNMCLNLATGHTQNNPANIWCPSDVQTAISNPVTGITDYGDLARFVFHTTARGNFNTTKRGNN